MKYKPFNDAKRFFQKKCQQFIACHEVSGQAVYFGNLLIVATYFTNLEMMEYYQKHEVQIASLQKLKAM